MESLVMTLLGAVTGLAIVAIAQARDIARLKGRNIHHELLLRDAIGQQPDLKKKLESRGWTIPELKL